MYMAKIFITGSSDGLGLLTAKALVSAGHYVVLHARNEERAKNTERQVPETDKVLIADLSSMAQAKKLAEQVNALGTFDAIVHNAGIYDAPHNAKSPDGLPLVFAVNSISPYILTALINRPQRLIYLSSGMHMHGNAGVGVLNSILEGKNIPGYSDTKLHDVILAFAVARKWPGVISNSVNPGWVPTKMGGRGAPDDLHEGYKTQVWLAVSQDPEAKRSGRFLRLKKEANHHPQADEIAVQEKFLAICGQLTGILFSPS
jgi:NAD(P)-dependent dehydrogenase (short-subunit alcohol dehydrogenase family)